MDGTYLTLQKNAYNIVEALTRIQDVRRHPTLQFKGSPAAFIAPSPISNDFLTQYENQRVYTFQIWVFTEYDAERKQTCFDEIMDCSQEIIDAFDAQESPDAQSRSMADNLNSATTLLAVMASPGEIIPDEEARLIGALITVRCKVTVDLTLI